MERVALNKTSLQKLNRDLQTYRQFLPTLDLKRRQLLLEQRKTRQQLQQQDNKLEQSLQRYGDELGILAISRIALHELVSITRFDTPEKNIVGVVLPEPGAVHFRVENYDVDGSPVWLEGAIAAARELITIKLHRQVLQRRSNLIDHAVQKTTQRLNLFDKVLIPQTSEQIRRIKLFLADEETASVVRAKLAKRKLLTRDEQETERKGAI